MEVSFDCTQCGKCCHDLKLPLSVAEAVTWLARGHQVQLLCEAVPWPAEPDPQDRQAAYKRRRSFEVVSGSMPVRVIVTLAASFPGACPNLGSDMRCGIYEERPRVCRIYPAEINPFVPFVQSAKVCPPQAWEAHLPPLLRGGVIVDAVTRSLVEQSRDASVDDVGTKARLCELLGIGAAALANEGFVVHSPGNEAMTGALAGALRAGAREPNAESNWLFVSANASTLAALLEIGAMAARPADAAVEFLDFAAA